MADNGASGVESSDFATAVLTLVTNIMEKSR
jgi:hypothetical protein